MVKGETHRVWNTDGAELKVCEVECKIDPPRALVWLSARRRAEAEVRAVPQAHPLVHAPILAQLDALRYAQALYRRHRPLNGGR